MKRLFLAEMGLLEVLTLAVLSLHCANVAALNLRATNPDYMAQAGNSDDIEKDRQDLGIAKGEFLAKIYTEIHVKYNESEFIAQDVWGKCKDKIKDAGQNEAALENKIGSATESDNIKDPVSGESTKMKWMDQRDNAKAEQIFFKQIIENAKAVLKEGQRGMREKVELRAKIGEMDKLEKLETTYNAQVDDADEVLAEAKRLMKQWIDSSKAYDCPVPTPVQHAEEQCKKGNTKMSIKCRIKCVPGYDDPDDSKNSLRCRKEGKFGRQLYGEWKGFATCVGRMCGTPAKIDKAKTVIQKIRFPHAAHYNCYEGYSQNADAKGPKTFAVPCGTTGSFEQNMSHVCQRVKCGDALVHEGTEKVTGTFFYSDTINYQCKAGYTLDETPGGLKAFPVTCQATGRFNHPGHGCKRVRCGPSPEYDDTTASRVTAQGEKHYGDLVDYKCQPGYSINQKPTGLGVFTLTCTAGGEFSLKGDSGDKPLPQCRPVSAGILPEVAHGNAKRREMFYGESIIITADVGYSTTGKPSEGTRMHVSVTTEGTFAGLEAFKPVLCGPATSVEKATTTFGSKDGVFGDILAYSCEDGYSTDKTDSDSANSFSLQCEADGDYSRVPDLGKCVNVDDCIGHSCGPHGDCVDHHKNYTCACQSGFEQTWDADAQQLVCGNINDCGAEACGVGTCKDLVNGYDCECPTGFKVVGEAEEKTCAPKQCGIPPSVDHSATSPTDDGSKKAVYKDKIVYQCDTGHTLDGKAGGKNHFDIDCRADKSFSATESCKPIRCGEAPKVDKSSVNPAKATYNDTVRYSCQDGHSIDGSPTGDRSFSIMCLVNGKYSDASSCKPVNCGEPDELPSASRPDGSLVYGESATYTCFDGFTLNGKKDGRTNFKIGCNADGDLDKLKQCLPKVCGIPMKHITALHATTSDEGAVAYPRQTEVTCRDGYTVGGSPGGNSSFTVECLATGEFDEHNEWACEPVRCGPVPPMSNATLSRVESPHKHQKHQDEENLNFDEQALYKCLDGFSIGGEPNAPKKLKVECLPNGQISAPAPEMQCRNINDCERHTCGAKGTCIDLIGPSPAYTCKCEFGFDLRTKPNGEKHCGNTDNCKDQGCGVGTCKDLIGDYTCICPGGYFIGKEDGVKTCVPVTCSDATPSLANGKQTTTHSGRIDFPTTLQYQCDQGYSIDGTAADSKQHFQAQCKPNAQLQGMMSCQKISCGSPRVLPFTKLVSHTPRNVIEYEEIVKYECDEGYTVGGKADADTKFKVKCPANGHLTDPLVCEPVYCGKAPGTRHGRAGISGDVFYGMHLEYGCDLGYTLDGSASGHTKFQRTCRKDGSFSELSAADGLMCNAIHGGKAPTLTNADLTEYAGKPAPSSPPDVYYPNGLEYRCKSGYSENGSPSGRTQISTKVNSLGQLWPALPTGCQLITFTIRGAVKDARNGRALNGVSVKLLGTTTNVRTILGFFVISGIRSGEVKLLYEKQGFIKAEKTINVNSDIALGGAVDIAMSPKMSSNEWRAVVKWGKKPTDLDTYGKFANTKVCYYSLNRKSRGMRAILEHDDTSSYGPETLYMKGLGNCRGSAQSCDFKYQINDFGANGNMKDISKAEVTLYTGDRVAGTWKIADCKNTVSRNGNWWHVFTIDGRTNKLKWACNQGQDGSEFNLLADPPHAHGEEHTVIKKMTSHTLKQQLQGNKTAAVTLTPT